jgi:CHAT domain-containing protein
MPKIFLYFFVSLSLCCCTAKKEKLAEERMLPLLKQDSSLPKDKGLWLLAAENRLQKLSALPDSITAYVQLNNTLYDSVKKWKGDKVVGKYQDNIIGLHQKIISDTSLRKILTKAYAWWGFDHFTEAYNDTIVSRLEQFLLLTHDQKPVNPLTLYVCQQLAIQYNVLGDLKKCGYYNNRFAELAKEGGNNDWYASGITNTTIALNESGLYDSSINLIKPLLNAKGIHPKRIANLYANLAEAEAGNKNFAAASNSAENSLKILDHLTPDDIDSSELLELKYRLWWNRGELQVQAKNYAEAATSLNKALVFLLACNEGNLKNRESGKLYLSIGRLLEQTGKLNEALHAFQKALHCVTNVDSNAISQLPSTKDLYVENTIMEALDAKAGVLQKLYKNNSDTSLLKQAVACYSLAFEVENKLTRGFSYDESLQRQTIKSKARSEKAVAACYQLSLLTRSSAWAEQAFFFAEKSKAVVLQESIRRNFAANGLLLNDTNWIRVQQIQQQVNFYEKEIAAKNAVDTAEINQLKNKLGKAENDLLFSKTALVHNNEAYREILLKTDSISIDAIDDQLLDDHTGLVEFFSGDSATYIFSLTKNNPPVFFKASNEINETLNNFLFFFANKNNINNQPVAFQLAAFNLFKLTGFANMQNNNTNLIIIPDGRFNFVPFEALVTDNVAVAGPKNFAYLLKNKQINYGYSASTILKMQENKNKTTSQKLVAFAPVFEANERGLSPLMHATEETDAMQQAIPSGKYFLKINATLSNFKNKINDAAIIHIASHGSAGNAGDMQPCIEFYDSTLYLNEIYTMHINPSLVVLSACETGIGVIDKSEGAMSLARGFYYAGAQNVITSLWNVDDRSTANIFGSFYQHLSDNDYAGSLYNAKLNYLKNATSANASPYYWAGFTHIGYQKPQQKNNLLIIFIAGIIAIAAFSFLIYRRKK